MTIFRIIHPNAFAPFSIAMGLNVSGFLHSILSRRCLYIRPATFSRFPVQLHHRSRVFSSFPSTMAALQRSALFEAINQHDRDSTAIVHSLSGRSFSYGSLLRDVANAKERLLENTGRDEQSIAGERVAFLIENSYDYVGAHTLSQENFYTVNLYNSR